MANPALAAGAEREAGQGWLVPMLFVGALASIIFATASMTVHILDPDYFTRLKIARLEDEADPVLTGAVEKAEKPHVVALPASDTFRSAGNAPEDYQIVMVFGSAAHLATRDGLWYVEVGTRLPGLGTILSIENNADGGVIRAEKATLRAVPRTP